MSAYSLGVQFRHRIIRIGCKATIRAQVGFMAKFHHRTWERNRVGHFLMSVHLDPVAGGHRLEHGQELSRLTQQLIELANALSLPITWAVSDPAYSAATPLILRSDVEHELAILGDANWLGPTAGRTRFARELARRVSHARNAGFPMTTLVPRVASVERHIDLVVKQRIAAVAGVETSPSGRNVRTPRVLHYGVWELPLCGILPTSTRWTLLNGWSVWRGIRRAAFEATMYHLVIDVPALLKDGPRAYRTVSRVLRQVTCLRKRGLLRVETLGMTAARLASVPAVSPQCSILRRVA
jgi:hypothetical protein